MTKQATDRTIRQDRKHADVQMTGTNKQAKTFIWKGATGAVLVLLAAVMAFLFVNGLSGYGDAAFLTAYVSKPVRMLLVLSMCVFLALFYGAAWKMLKRCKDSTLRVITVVLCVFAVLLQLFFLFYYRSSYLYDSAAVTGAASSLAQTRQVAEDAFYYMSVYPNQNAFVVMTMLLWKFGRMLSIPAGSIPILLNFVNLLCIDISVILIFATIRIWKENCSRAAQTFLLLLIVMHPFLYIGVSYYYTMTLSMPFLTAVLYLAVRRLHRPESFRFSHAVIWGVLFAAGYLLRATTVIVMVAAIICLLLARKWNRRDFAAVLVAIACIVGLGKINTAIVGIDTTDSAFPVTHWLMMSLTSPGNHNAEDEAFTASFATGKEKREAVKARYLEKMTQLGPSGLAKLVPAKIKNTWGDGANGYPHFLKNCLRTGAGYTYIFGDHNDFVILYHQGYYLLQLFVICAAACMDVRSGKQNAFLFQLSLLGAVLFYVLWETGAQYSLAFWSLLLLLTIDGISRFLPDLYENGYGSALPGKERPGIAAIWVAAGLFSALFLAVFFWKKMPVFTGQTQTFSTPAASQMMANHELPVSDGDVFVQNFTASGPFNRLICQFRNDSGESDAVYRIRLCGGKAGEIGSWDIAAQGQPYNGAAICTFDGVTQWKDETFSIEISKISGQKENNLRFVTFRMGEYDAYPLGKCVLSGEELGQDLLFEAAYVSESAYTTRKRYTIFAIASVLLYTIVTITFWMENQKCRKFQ